MLCIEALHMGRKEANANTVMLVVEVLVLAVSYLGASFDASKRAEMTEWVVERLCKARVSSLRLRRIN